MQNKNNEQLLLDTHVWIWLLNGNEGNLKPEIVTTIQQAASSELLRISAISLWEVAMLESKGRIHIGMECLSWLNAALAAPGISLIPLTAEIAVCSCILPGEFHGDPADRIIVATAKILGALLVTRDANIVNYGRQGYLSVLRI
ncbi:MAG: type II toxin-antitoxin system VapC family toxin [Candidatus Xenobiia bacterium LiM19]